MSEHHQEGRMISVNLWPPERPIIYIDSHLVTALWKGDGEDEVRISFRDGSRFALHGKLDVMAKRFSKLGIRMLSTPFGDYGDPVAWFVPERVVWFHESGAGKLKLGLEGGGTFEYYGYLLPMARLMNVAFKSTPSVESPGQSPGRARQDDP